jgi:hypothetical protein
MSTLRGAAFATGLSLACLVGSQVFAGKVELVVTPRNAENAGFAISALPVEYEGAARFIVKRDLSKAKSLDPELMIRRQAILRVGNDAGLIVDCRIEPGIEKNIATYSFTLARRFLPQARLTVTEYDDYRNSNGRAPLIGGGTIYTIDLDMFKDKE